MQEIKTIIQLRNDTADNWATKAGQATPLMPGEVAVEIVDGKAKLKIGTDEKSTFGNSEYFGSEPTQVYRNSGYAAHDAVETDEQIIAALVGDNELHNGDCAIVKRAIDENNRSFSYTSYVYDDGKWIAMDGNYSASNVYLKDKIVLAGDYGKDSRNDKITSIGNYRIGDTINAGTSLQEMFTTMLSQRLQPGNPTNPSTGITLYMDGSTKKTAAGAVEVGTTVNPYYVTSFNKGSYTYGPSDTGVTANSYSITSTGRKTVSGATNDTTEDSATATSGSFNSFIVDDDTSYKLNVSVSHSGGVDALDNLGSVSDPVKKIAAGTKTNTSGTVTGFRSVFYGYKTAETALDVNNLTSEQIRKLGSPITTTKPSTMTTNKMKQMFFALPANTVSQVVVKDATNGAPQTVSKTTVSVEGANGFTAIPYDVFYVDNAAAAGGELTFNITY